MAESCSFITLSKRYKEKAPYFTKDSACFASLTSSYSIPKAIIIEEHKLVFSKNRTREFLRAVKAMGFPFSYKWVEKEKHFRIDVQRIAKGKIPLLIFATIIRCLWEGQWSKHKRKITDRNNAKKDVFTDVVRHYFNLRLITRGSTTAELLTLAINAFIKSGQDFWGLHFFVGSDRNFVNVIKDFSGYEKAQSVHTFFTNYDKPSVKNYKKNPDDWTKKDYLLLLKNLNYEVKEK